MEWSQPKLIWSRLKDLGLVDVKTNNQPATRTSPSLTTVTLASHGEASDDDEYTSFKYKHIVGKMLHLEMSTRPDMHLQ
jgi:hypothetical protein